MTEAVPHDGRGICGGIWHGERLSETRRKRFAGTGDAGTKGRDYRLSELWERADRACRGQESSLMIKGIYNPAVVSEPSGTFRIERH